MLWTGGLLLRSVLCNQSTWAVERCNQHLRKPDADNSTHVAREGISTSPLGYLEFTHCTNMANLTMLDLPAGPNGCGKSTLLRLIMGQEEPIKGRVQLGPHNITPAYFAQNQADALDLKQSVLNTMIKAAPDAQLNDVKALLGRMMFSGKAMEKKVSVNAKSAMLALLSCCISLLLCSCMHMTALLPAGCRSRQWVTGLHGHETLQHRM